LEVVPVSKRRAYRAVAVKNVSLENVLQSGPEGAVTVGMDVGKDEIFVVLRWVDATFERPWKVRNPLEVKLLVRILTELNRRRCLTVGMESTGTYGDSLRQALTDAKLSVHRVSGKATHDYAEIFDGVPSQHDGKDAAMIAELVAFGKSSPWPFEHKEANDAEMAYWVDWLDGQQQIEMLWLGRLESLLARHWPEATTLLKLSSATLLQTLARYGGPGGLAEDDGAARRLAGWGGPKLTAKKIEKVIRSATETVGVRQNAQDVRRIQEYATLALEAYRQTQKAKRALERLAKGNEVIQRQAEAVGVATACVLWVALGDPKNYPFAAAYRKAMGFNLKVRSSGKHKGKLKITKRGPSVVRRWLYFAAMRMVQRPEVKPWHEAKKARTSDKATPSLVAVARKLALAMHVVGARGERFDPGRLFPGCPLPRGSSSARGEAA